MDRRGVKSIANWAWYRGGESPGGRWVLNVARWPLVAVIMVRALATLYHGLAGRPSPGSSGVRSSGPSLWLLASGLFAL
jgi:hypothetical protein